MPLKTSNLRNSPSPWKAASNYSEPELASLAHELAQELRLGDRVFLEGPMGAGKSTFARHLLVGLGILQPAEGSPTFALAHEYQAAIGGIIHIDFYRIRSAAEIDDAGIPAYYWERHLIVISEWLSSWPEFMEQIVASSFANRTHSQPGNRTVTPAAGSEAARGGRIWRIDLAWIGDNEASGNVTGNAADSDTLRRVAIFYQ